MKKILLPALVFFTSFFASAQQSVPEFGKIDPVDLKLKQCPFEPEAGAMNLFDVQEIEYRPDNYVSRLTIERRVRIKIFKEAGYQFASIKLPYYSKKGVTKIKDITGIIYNLDAAGNIVTQKLEKKDFFKEKAEENIAVINFTFPNVKPGSVIEFRYTKIEKNIIDIDPWIVQGEIPTAFASTTITAPVSCTLKEKIYGADTIAQKRELLKKGGIQRFKKTYYRGSIHSFQPEPFMSSYKDNLLKVIFMLVPRYSWVSGLYTSPETAWKLSAGELLNSPFWGLQIDTPIPGTDSLIEAAKKMSMAARINFIYEEVKKRAPAKIEQTLDVDNILDAWNNKTGTTGELNLILLNLLSRAAVECYPLLISTRDHGKINIDFPSPGQFDGVDVLAMDSGVVYIMDAALKYQSFQNPPPNIMNRKGFLLMPGSMKWVVITDDRLLLKVNTDIFADLSDSGYISGNGINWYYDYAKSSALDSSDEETRDRFFDKKTEGLQILSTIRKNADDITQPLQESVQFRYEPQHTNEFYFVNPQFLLFKKDNPFTRDKRHTDIDMGSSQSFTLNFNLSIPPGFQLSELPKSITVRAPDSSFFYKRICSADSYSIQVSQIFEIKRSQFDRDEYPAIKDFFSRAYTFMGEDIVLKKIR